ncbi:MAG: MFS transporter [Bacillota bacterium]
MKNIEHSEKIVTTNFMALFGAIFFLFFALDYYIPILPFYVLHVGGSEASVGMLMGLFTFCSVVLRPFQGRNINHRGRKRLLITGISLYAAAGLGLLFLPSLPLLFFFRAVQGFGWGAFLLAFNTLILDLAPPGRSGQMVGLMGMAPPFSLATAPILGEHLRITTADNYIVLFLIASIAALIALLLAIIFKEPIRGKTVEIQSALFSRKVLYPSLIIFCMTFTLGAILTFLPLFGEVRNIQTVGYFFTVFALTTVFSRPAAGRLSDHFGRPKIFLPALVIAAAALIMIATAVTELQLIASAFVLGIGFGSAHSPVMAMAADRLPVMERGIGMATFTSAFDLGIVTGSVTLGILLMWFDFTLLFILCASIMLIPILGNLIKHKMKALF